MKPACAVLFVLFTTVLVQAEWSISDRRDFRDEAGRVRSSELLLTNGADQARMQILYFSPREIHFRVVPNLDGSIGGVRNVVERAGGIAGTNGGYFETDLTPLGLLISDGRLVHPLQKAKLLSGALIVKRGVPAIVRTRDLSNVRDVDQAIQCGPFLIEHGQPVPGLNSEKIAPRTFVFCCDQDYYGLGICRSVTLAALGEILAGSKVVRDHTITKALNLDGGSSTALYAKLGGHEIFSEGRSEVSNYLIVGTAFNRAQAGSTF